MDCEVGFLKEGRMERDEKNTEEEFEEKSKFYKKNKTIVHVTLNNSFFYNGEIIEVKSNFIILKDKKLGEMPFFFREIKNIEPQKLEGDNET